MNQRKFLDLLDLAWQDFRQDDASAVGLIITVIHRNEHDDMALQTGANVAPEMIRYVLKELARGHLDFEQSVAQPLRKVV